MAAHRGRDSLDAAKDGLSLLGNGYGGAVEAFLPARIGSGAKNTPESATAAEKVGQARAL
jgi:hypothetical protein